MASILITVGEDLGVTDSQMAWVAEHSSLALSFFLPVSWCLLVLGAASICSWNGLNFHLEGRAVFLSGLLVSKETESFPAWAQPLEF